MARDRAARPQAKPLRLFAGVEVPQAPRQEVASFFSSLREEFPHARWVPERNWHVTLKFLGWTYPRLVEWVQSQIGSVALDRSGFETRLSGVGAFPSPRRARVVWAGLDDRAGRLAELAGAIDAALTREFRSESRPFRPHLTVARSEPPIQLPDGFGAESPQPVSFRIERVVLFRSHLQRPAPRYEEIGAFPLAG